MYRRRWMAWRPASSTSSRMTSQCQPRLSTVDHLRLQADDPWSWYGGAGFKVPVAEIDASHELLLCIGSSVAACGTLERDMVFFCFYFILIYFFPANERLTASSDWGRSRPCFGE